MLLYCLCTRCTMWFLILHRYEPSLASRIIQLKSACYLFQVFLLPLTGISLKSASIYSHEWVLRSRITWHFSFKRTSMHMFLKSFCQASNLLFYLGLSRRFDCHSLRVAFCYFLCLITSLWNYFVSLRLIHACKLTICSYINALVVLICHRWYNILLKLFKRVIVVF